MNITVTRTWQGWVVAGGNLPRDACWGIFATEGEARRFAREVADELAVEVA